MPAAPLRVLALFVLALECSCAATLKGESTPAVPAGGGQASTDESPAARAYARALAELELHAVQLDNQAKKVAADQAVDVAERELAQARQAQEEGLKEAQIELRSGEVELQALRVRVSETQGDLAELESMYQEEEFAAKTKELVLQRGKSQVELAGAALGVAEMRHQLLVSDTLPAKQRAADLTVRKAEIALEAAQAARENAALQARIALKKAEEALRAAAEGAAED